MARIYEKFADTVGNTPLVKIPRLNAGRSATVLVKMESFNPAGSVKDRIGVSMIEAAERDGRLSPGMTIVEPTSGNTGIALAFVAAAKGYPLILVMPDTMTVERRNLLKAYGAQVVLTPGARRDARRAPPGQRDRRERDPRSISCRSSSRIRPIRRSIAARPAEEIWRDTDGAVDVFVSAVGTGGTITGVGEVLKARKPAEGDRGRAGRLAGAVGRETRTAQDSGTGARIRSQGSRHRASTTKCIRVTDADAIATARRAAREEGHARRHLSRRERLGRAAKLPQRPESKGKTIVTIGCDTGERYLSNPVFAEQEANVVEPALTNDVAEPWQAETVPEGHLRRGNARRSRGVGASRRGVRGGRCRPRRVLKPATWTRRSICGRRAKPFIAAAVVGAGVASVSDLSAARSP